MRRRRGGACLRQLPQVNPSVRLCIGDGTVKQGGGQHLGNAAWGGVGCRVRRSGSWAGRHVACEALCTRWGRHAQPGHVRARACPRQLPAHLLGARFAGMQEWRASDTRGRPSGMPACRRRSTYRRLAAMPADARAWLRAQPVCPPVRAHLYVPTCMCRPGSSCRPRCCPG